MSITFSGSILWFRYFMQSWPWLVEWARIRTGRTHARTRSSRTRTGVTNYMMDGCVSYNQLDPVPIQADPGSNLSKGTISIFWAIFLVVNAALGAGLVIFPLSFYMSGGVVTGIVLELVSTFQWVWSTIESMTVEKHPCLLVHTQRAVNNVLMY